MRRRLLLLVFACGAARPTVARAEAQLWTKAGATFHASKRIELSVSEERRLGDLLPRGGQWLTSVGAEYRLMGRVFVGAGYRLSAEWAEPQKELGTRRRGTVDLTMAPHWGDFRPKYRLRGQARLGANEDEDRVLDLEPGLRNRLSLDYRGHPSFQPGATFELFSDFVGRRQSWTDRYRTGFGVAFVQAPVKLDLTYLYDAPIDDRRPAAHIAYLGVTVEIDLRHKD